MTGRPKLQILWAIVVPNPVDMMHGLVGKEGATEMLFHDGAMLRHVYATPIGPRQETVSIGDRKTHIDLGLHGSIGLNIPATMEATKMNLAVSETAMFAGASIHATYPRLGAIPDGYMSLRITVLSNTFPVRGTISLGPMGPIAARY